MGPHLSVPHHRLPRYGMDGRAGDADRRDHTTPGWFHPDQLPTQHTATVEMSVQLLEQYDRTGEFVAP